MNPAVLAAIQALAPVVMDAVRAWQKARNTDALPTDAEVRAELEANLALYLSEGAAWKSQHPET